jgi:Domain of unknown function (DUF6362)
VTKTLVFVVSRRQGNHMTEARTAQQIVDQIKCAVHTARHLPPVFAKPRTPYWPPVIRALLQESKAPPSIETAPMTAQLSELDQVIWWLMWVPGETARILWARAEGYSWDSIATMAGENPEACKTIFRMGVLMITKLYNQPEMRTA